MSLLAVFFRNKLVLKLFPFFFFNNESIIQVINSLKGVVSKCDKKEEKERVYYFD